MKMFDLEKALAGDPIICRNGQVPSEWHYFKTIKDENKIIIVVDGLKYFLNEKGYLVSENYPNEEDIFMQQKKIKLWVNIFKDENGYYGFAYSTLEEAKAKSEGRLIKTQEIEVEV